MRVKMTAAAVAMAALTMVLSAPAFADVIKVRPGQSIQAAIDKADPGDKVKLKPGTYHENVQILKNDIELQGSGKWNTTIVPSTTPTPVCGAGEPGPDAVTQGICVANADEQFNVKSIVQDTEISDLAVKGFDGAGIFFFGANGQKVHDVIVADNHEYGIAAFNSSNGRYEQNAAARNGEAGIYLGDSPNAHSRVRGNTSWDNEGFGIFLRDASFGQVEHNWMYGNCVGLIFLHSGGGIEGWTATGNRAVANNRACAGNPQEQEPGFSGIGIAVAGAKNIDIEHNTVLDNRPSGETEFSGGILVGASGSPPEGVAPTGIRVAFNVAFGNQPFDLLWDGSGTNIVFDKNHCKTSSPDGLCVSGRPHGDGHHGHGHGHKHQGKHGEHHGKHKSKHHNKHHESKHHNKHHKSKHRS